MRPNEMIAAARRAVEAISKTAQWPLTMLAAKVTKANRHMIRWALRHDSPAVYLFAVLWSPALAFAAGAWLVASAVKAPAGMFGINLVVVNKVLVIILYAITLAYRVRKPLRFYRRHF